MAELTRAIALDCEMVAGGTLGNQEMLAKVSLVNERGECILDMFVKPTSQVTDYRTNVSGIRKINLENGEDFVQVQRKVKNILSGRILVGHDVIENDLKLLKQTHPINDIRDTAKYEPFIKENQNLTPSLRWLASQYLSVVIQSGEHSSMEDARTVMKIYKKFSTIWEKSLGNSVSV